MMLKYGESSISLSCLVVVDWNFRPDRDCLCQSDENKTVMTGHLQRTRMAKKNASLQFHQIMCSFTPIFVAIANALVLKCSFLLFAKENTRVNRQRSKSNIISHQTLKTESRKKYMYFKHVMLFEIVIYLTCAGNIKITPAASLKWRKVDLNLCLVCHIAHGYNFLRTWN